MLNPGMRLVYSLLGIAGGGVYPVVLVPVLFITYWKYAVTRVSAVEGDIERITHLVDRTIFFLMNVSAVVGLRLHWGKISRILHFFARTRKAVGSRMRIHPHTLILFLFFTYFNSSMLINKSLTEGSMEITLPEFFHFLIYNTLMVQYTDVTWTTADLFACLNSTLARELSQPSNGKKWFKLIELHTHLVQNTEELYGCLRFHMLIGISYVFLKMTYVPYQVIRNWMKPAIGTLLNNSYLNLLLITFNLIDIVSLFTPSTAAMNQSNNTRKILRKFANKGHQKKEILSAIMILSENPLKFTFYGLINIRTLSLVPMMHAIITNLVILINTN